MVAFRAFGLALMGVEEADFSRPGTQYKVGRAPVAIDFLTSVAELNFEECRKDGVVDVVGGIAIPYLGKRDLIHTKEIAGRPEDFAHIRNLTMLDEEEE